ncbi:MAG TPA: cell division protein ZapB [candidate division Zixibacteria bacterium]
MQLDNFEKLEEKIVQAMDLISNLKQENEEISSTYRKLTEEIQGFENVAKSKATEAELYKHELSSRERDFMKRREEVKKRLEKLLERLAPLERSEEEAR